MKSQNKISQKLFILLTPLLFAGATSFSQDIDKNKDVIRTLFLEVLGNKKIDLYLTLHTSDFVAHGLKKDVSLEEDYQATVQLTQSFESGKIEITHLVAEGSFVSARWIASGMMGGNKMFFDGATFFRMDKNKIAEEWGLVNTLEMMRQTGQLPDTMK